jgi:hypothetical protein
MFAMKKLAQNNEFRQAAPLKDERLIRIAKGLPHTVSQLEQEAARVEALLGRLRSTEHPHVEEVQGLLEQAMVAHVDATEGFLACVDDGFTDQALFEESLFLAYEGYSLLNDVDTYYDEEPFELDCVAC